MPRKLNNEAGIIFHPMNRQRSNSENCRSGKHNFPNSYGITRNNELTVAGSLTNTPTSLSINGQSAGLYNDKTFAASGVGLNDGMNTFTAIMVTAGGSFTNSTSKTLPASVRLTSDLNGNLIYDGQKAYQYDCANELTSVTVSNSWRNEYVYDGFGRRRVAKNYVWYGGTWQEGAEKRYVYDGNNVIQERDGNNHVLVSYTRGTDLSGDFQGAGGIGGLLARTDVNGSAFYHSDGNGNITTMIDSSGNQLAKYLYDSFGNTIGMWGSLAAVNTYRFSSKEIDTRSWLYYYGYRYYDPNFQRWLNCDPIREAGGINLYGYVQNNPINEIDPYGLDNIYGGYSGGTYNNNVPNITLSGSVGGGPVNTQFNGGGLQDPLFLLTLIAGGPAWAVGGAAEGGGGFVCKNAATIAVSGLGGLAGC
jgi:RHS repeat-associated protein